MKNPNYESLTKFNILHTGNQEIKSLRDQVIKIMSEKCELSIAMMTRYVKEVPEMYDEFKNAFNVGAQFLIKARQDNKKSQNK